MTIRTTIVAGVVLALAACDNGPSAVETRDRAGEVTEVALTAVAAPAAAAEAPTTEAAPVMTANRRETVDAKVQRLYERNGADFGAKSPEDFLTKVEAFTQSPPAGVDTAKGSVAN